ncbi:sugar phosphate isomerase/epimerase [Edaphobacter paludis]|uniref:Sugar phosphate isomerase/epimerase n=1 Tax=Edaphobacter paludis TaxID=3035702 RepID=A0AAU7CUA5_9BACT
MTNAANAVLSLHASRAAPSVWPEQHSSENIHRGGRMHHKLARRQFLKTVGLGALAATGMELLELPAVAAISPAFNTNSSNVARLLSGCCAYSYDKELRQGTMTLEDFILKAVELRLDGIDMTAYYFKSTDPKYLHGLRHLAYKHAVPFSGSACRASMVQADAKKRADCLKEIKKWVDVTEQLGASHLRIFAGKLPPDATLQQGIGWTVETMKAGCDYSAQKGITLGLEDHVGVSQSADVCLEIMQRVNSPYAGINLDITNYIPTASQDAYAQIAACVPYATHIHIRDHFYDHTPVDMDRVWQLFAKAGYKGYVSAEYERSLPGGDAAAVGVPKLVAEIQTLCRKYSSV